MEEWTCSIHRRREVPGGGASWRHCGERSAQSKNKTPGLFRAGGCDQLAFLKGMTFAEGRPTRPRAFRFRLRFAFFALWRFGWCAPTASGKTVPNVGLKMKNEDICAGIKERETRFIRDGDGKERIVREDISYGVLDPRCFATEAIFKGGAIFRQADNARVREFGAASGWGQVRGRLLGNDDGEPMIFCFSTLRRQHPDDPGVAQTDPRTFCTLLGKILPTQVAGDAEGGPCPHRILMAATAVQRVVIPVTRCGLDRGPRRCGWNRGETRG
jgi:hypothetical protein